MTYPQIIELLFTVIVAIGIGFYFIIKEEEIAEHKKIFALLEVIFVIIGSLIIYFVYDANILTNVLTLKKFKPIGRIINIGYCFLIISILFFIKDGIRSLKYKKHEN